MILQVNKRVFSLGDTYDILDGNGAPIYQVRGHALSLGKKLDLLDMAGNEVAHIEQRLLSLVSEYDIMESGQVTAVVKKQLFSLFKPRFTVEGVRGAYEMEGDWLNWNYTISANGTVVAQVGKQFNLIQDRFGIEIVDGEDVPMLLCLAIVIDEVMHQSHQSSGLSGF